MRHDQAGYPDTVLYVPPRIVHHGITPATRELRPPRPLTGPQQEILSLLTDEPQRVAALARTSGRPGSNVQSSLYALALRGVAMRIPYKGWRLP